MKKITTLQSILFLFLFTLSSISNAALLKGGFRGKLNDRADVDILLQKVPGRKGSFFGLIMRGDNQMSIYLIDLLKSKSYAMTPLEVTSDGEIGIKNDNPSLVLQVSDNYITVSSSQSNNSQGFKGYMKFFFKKKSSWTWDNVVEGNYGNSLFVGSLNPTEREAESNFTHERINGHFVIREKFPKMYTINSQKITRVGAQVKKSPLAIGVFLKHKGVGFFESNRGNIFFLINPENDRDILKFEEERSSRNHNNSIKHHNHGRR